jgi:opacity protein-like surface antigen
MKALFSGLIVLGLAQAAAAAPPLVDRPDRVQIFLGVMDIDDDVGELQNDQGEPVDVDFDNLPTIGIEVETPMGSHRDEGLEYGINAGGGLSWSGDGTSFRGTSGGNGANIRFRIDNSFLLAEFHLGGFLRGHLGKWADVYVGAGPAILFGSHDVEDEDGEEEDLGSGTEPVMLADGTIILGDDSDSDFAIGYYARAGIEFNVGGNSQMGVGVRYLGAEMEFDDTIGKVDVDGLQILFTYSAWF